MRRGGGAMESAQIRFIFRVPVPAADVRRCFRNAHKASFSGPPDKTLRAG